SHRGDGNRRIPRHPLRAHRPGLCPLEQGEYSADGRRREGCFPGESGALERVAGCGKSEPEARAGTGRADASPLKLVALSSKVLRLWPWLAAIATGLLSAGCFAPFNYYWLCWVALIPLLAAIWFSDQNSKRLWARDLILGYVAGLAFFWVLFSWLHTVTVPGWILVGAYMALYFADWSWLCSLLRPGLRRVREKPLEGLRAVSRLLNERYAAEHGS